MAQTIKLKRSATTGNAPTASQLALGELGINTTDGKLFLKKSVSGTESIVEVGGLPLSGGTLTGNLSLGDNVKLQLGNQTNGDLQIYHDGSHSYIADVGTGDLVLQAGNDLILRQPDGSTEYLRANEGAGVQIYHNGSQKFLTTSTGIDVTGTISFGDSHTIGNDGFDNLTITSSTSENIVLKPSGATYIEHAGSTKFVTTSTGIDVTGTATMDGLTVDGDGLIQANMGAKLEIKATDNFINNGEVVGSLDFISADYNYTAQPIKGQIRTESVSSTGESAVFISTTETTNLRNRIKIDKGGDISFYEDTGTTAKLFWDSSTSQLRVGSTSAIFTNSVIQGVSALGPTIGAKQTTANQFAGGFWNNNSGDVSLIAFYAGFGGSQIGSIKGNSTSVQLLGSSGSGLSISSTGNVNIPNGSLMVGATTAPSGKLHIKNGASGATYTADGADQLILENNDSMMMDIRTPSGNTGGILFSDNNARGRGVIQYAHSNDTMYINTAGASALTLDSSQNATFSGDLSVTSKLTLTKAPVGTYSIEVDGTNTGQPNLIVKQSTSERFRCDNNGNLLVGTSNTTWQSQEGLRYFNGNSLIVTRDSDEPMSLNRLTNDGNLLIFRKDGTAVGSIGSSNSSSVTYLAGSASGGGIGVANNSPAVFPARPAGVIDNTINLGSGFYRFKDLYLSNKVYAAYIGASSDTDTSINFDTANTIKMFTGGQEAARIDASQNFLVGTTDDVVWNNNANSSADRGHNLRSDGRAGFAYYNATANANATVNINRTGSDGDLIRLFKSGSTVGSIGTFTGYTTIGGNTNGGLIFRNGEILPWNNAGGAYSNGGIDLGDGNAKFKDLHLSGTANVGAVSAINNITANGVTIGASDVRSSSGILTLGGTSENARFSGGNLLVGTTGANTYSSTVNTGVQIAPDFIGVARNQNTVMHLNRQGNDGTIVDFRTFGFVRGSVSISGSTTSYNTSSDERLKDNIIDAPIASEDIDAIQVRSFDWKADGEHQKYGMVAQELLEVAPDAVTQGDTPDDMMGVDYSKLVPMLIKEIQSLRQRVAQLEE